VNEEGKQKLTTHLERCLTLELVDDYRCVEVRADKLAWRWAEAGKVQTGFGQALAHEHARWALKHNKKLKERYLSAKKTEVQ
jgi:hypothetical protein